MTRYKRFLAALMCFLLIMVNPALSQSNEEVTLTIRLPKTNETPANEFVIEKLNLNGKNIEEVKSIADSLEKLDFTVRKFTIVLPANGKDTLGTLKIGALSETTKNKKSGFLMDKNAIKTEILNFETIKDLLGEDATNDFKSTNDIPKVIISISGNYTVGGKEANFKKEIAIGEKRVKTAPKRDDSDKSTVPEFTKEEYYKAIRLRDPDFQANQLSRNGDTIYAFFDAKMKIIEGVILPNCNNPNSYYRFFVLGKRESDKNYELAIETEEFVTADFIINIGQDNLAGAVNSTSVPQVLCKALVGTVSAGVRMRVNFLVNDKLVQGRNYTIPSCNDGYHVSIMAGFYRSELSLPNNIRTATINGVNTLVADNPDNQLAVVLSAVFYPKPRPFFYEYKSLDFWNKWSFSLGTKFSQNLFDDAFLGLNYEFAKGATFITGMHYGQHTVINGYNNFKFGSTPFSSSSGSTQFNAASDVHLRWNTAWFFGVNIDLRVLGAFRGANENNNFRRSQPTTTNPTTPAPAPTPTQPES